VFEGRRGHHYRSIGCVISVIESLGCGRDQQSSVCECDRDIAGSKGGVGFVSVGD
jgi:hypothetical protein